MNRQSIIHIALGFALGAICIAFLLLAGAARATPAADPPPQEQEAVALQAGAPALVGYQGRLANPTTGDPLSGTYGATFRICDALTGGAACWGEAKTITVTDGDFSTYLGSANPTGLVACLGGGTARWLQVEIGGETLSPRLRLASAPYAIQTEQAKYAASAPWSGLTGVPAGFADGVDNDTTYSAGNQLSLVGTTFNVVEGSGSGLDADLLDGQHASAFAAGTHDHDARYYTESEADARYVNEGQADSVTGAMIQDGGVGSADVSFNYAGSTSKGGPAADLSCAGCVSSAEVDFNYAGSSSKGGMATNADMVDSKHASDLAAATHTHTKADIADEPGIAFDNFLNRDIASTSLVNVGYVQITAPASGYVLVQAAGDIGRNYAGGSAVAVCIGTSSSTCSSYNPWVTVPSGSVLGVYWWNFAVSHVFAVSAGSYPYYLNACLLGDTVHPATVLASSFQALYFPSAYGTTALSTGATVTKAP